MVGASLEVMDRDAKKMRGEWSFVFSNLKTNAGLDKIVEFIQRQGGGRSWSVLVRKSPARCLVTLAQ